MNFVKKLLAFIIALPLGLLLYTFVILFLLAVGAVGALLAPMRVWAWVSKQIDRSV